MDNITKLTTELEKEIQQMIKLINATEREILNYRMSISKCEEDIQRYKEELKKKVRHKNFLLLHAAGKISNDDT